MKNEFDSSIIATLVAGTDRCGVYLGSGDLLKIAQEIGFDVDLKAPEFMLKDIIKYTDENSKTKELCIELCELFSARIADYEALKNEFKNSYMPFLETAKKSLAILQKGVL